MYFWCYTRKIPVFSFKIPGPSRVLHVVPILPTLAPDFLRPESYRSAASNIYMLTCNTINIMFSYNDIIMMHINIVMSHVDVNTSPKHIMLHVDKIHLAWRGWRGQKYATIRIYHRIRSISKAGLRGGGDLHRVIRKKSGIVEPSPK